MPEARKIKIPKKVLLENCEILEAISNKILFGKIIAVCLIDYKKSASYHPPGKLY